ncbi:MAG: ZIP family metal transporter [Saprospiraceae bacterium]
MAITLHNIPEGLAVGVLFGGVAAGIPEASITAAVVLAIGIGIQNFPEGIAVAMPLKRMGMSNKKSFMYGQSSALVEPIAGVAGALAVNFFTPILPYALAFAAGAMIFVVVEEVIPETQQDRHTDISTLGFIGGFIVMMTLDVALG